jgi:hypothetical protein
MKHLSPRFLIFTVTLIAISIMVDSCTLVGLGIGTLIDDGRTRADNKRIRANYGALVLPLRRIEVFWTRLHSAWWIGAALGIIIDRALILEFSKEKYKEAFWF